ncbi:MAG: hypothetical protein KA024_01655 [Zoogloea sp.]|jgi:hypothetical protein|nr:hypothetical protein [Zoogloea sp.]
MLKLIQILWPSFLVAGAAEIVFFTVVAPKELYLFGEPAHFSAIATYSIGFFAFWIVCAASSLTTLFFQRTSNEINQSDSI